MCKCFKKLLVCFCVVVLLYSNLHTSCMCLWSVCMFVCVHMSCVASCRLGVMYPAVKPVDNWHHGQTLSSLS